MRDFFNRPHPWLMQAIGGLIAVIVMIPIAIYVVVSVINSPAPEASVPVMVPPSQTSETGPAGTPGNGSASGGGNRPGNTGKPVMVYMQPGNAPAGYVFSPAKITIHVGQTVTWEDKPGDTMVHNVIGTNNKLLNYGATSPGTGPYSVTFTKPGDYKYQCTLHTGMVGEVIVK